MVSCHIYSPYIKHAVHELTLSLGPAFLLGGYRFIPGYLTVCGYGQTSLSLHNSQAFISIQVFCREQKLFCREWASRHFVRLINSTVLLALQLSEITKELGLCNPKESVKYFMAYINLCKKNKKSRWGSQDG